MQEVESCREGEQGALVAESKKYSLDWHAPLEWNSKTADTLLDRSKLNVREHTGSGDQAGTLVVCEKI